MAFFSFFFEAGGGGVTTGGAGEGGQNCQNALFRLSCVPPKARLVSNHLLPTVGEHVPCRGGGAQACSCSDYMSIKHLLKERGGVERGRLTGRRLPRRRARNRVAERVIKG